MSCTGPRACYDESKRYGETLCVNFAQQHGLPIKVARPFNNYGPGLKITDRRVIPDFARDHPRRPRHRDAVRRLGDADILLRRRRRRRATTRSSSRAGRGEAYNVGVETPEISMRELAQRARRARPRAVRLPGPRSCTSRAPDKDYLVDNPMRRCPIITKARTELGYDPQVGLDEGLRRSLIWYAGNREASEA